MRCEQTVTTNDLRVRFTRSLNMRFCRSERNRIEQMCAEIKQCAFCQICVHENYDLFERREQNSASFCSHAVLFIESAIGFCTHTHDCLSRAWRMRRARASLGPAETSNDEDRDFLAIQNLALFLSFFLLITLTRNSYTCRTVCARAAISVRLSRRANFSGGASVSAVR